MSEDINNKDSKLKSTGQRLGLAALGGIIGAVIGVTIISGGSISIPEILRADGSLPLVLLPVLLSLPTALIKHPARSFGLSLLVGGIVAIAGAIFYFIAHLADYIG